jgi:hypothetical protein
MPLAVLASPQSSGLLDIDSLTSSGQLSSEESFAMTKKIAKDKAVLSLLTFAMFLNSLTSFAQEPRVRITEPIDNSALVRVPGTHHPLASAENDLGRVNGDTSMARMVLVLKSGQEQAAALTRLINGQHDKQSPVYHNWLTPEQYGAQFGPAQQDLDQITAWLKQQGFRVDAVARGRHWIEFSGSAAQVESAFHTAMHHYLVKGEDHIANADDISLPRSLAPVVDGVLTLHNFRKHAAHSKAFQLHRDETTGEMTRIAELVPSQKGVTVAPMPDLTSGSSHYLTPGDYSRIYNTLPLLKDGVDGTDVSIAIVGRTDINLSDVQAFRHVFELPANDPTFIVNGIDPGINGDEEESDLDVEWSGAVAPNASIKFVTTNSTFTTDGVDLSISYIVDNRVAPIMSTSYGQCEAFLGTTENAFYNSVFRQAAAEGITAFVASGDNGPAGCDAAVSTHPAQYGLNVSGLASTPYNVAVGGTEFMENGDDSTYWLAENRPDLSSAIGYIPEAVWNESCDPTVDPNHCLGSGYYLLWSSSGGSSSCTQSTVSGGQITCISGYPKPSWQAGTGVLNDGTRDLPDLAMAASGGHDGYLLCVEGSCQWTVQKGQIVLTQAAVVGGTSAGAPSMAGVMALVEQKNGTYQGLANYSLYQLAASEKLALCNSSKRTDPTKDSACVFYDVTAGNNNVPGQQGFNAGRGFDMGTGLGSVNASNLVNAWGSAKKLGSATTLSAGTTTVQHGTPLPLKVGVQPLSGAGTPSGDFSILSEQHGSVFGASLVSGSFSGGVNGLEGGAYSIKAHYGGDAMFGASDSSPLRINVTPEPSVVTATGWQVILAGQYWHSLLGPVNYGQQVAIQFNVQGKSGIGSAGGEATVILDDAVNLGTYPLNQSGSGWAEVDNFGSTGLVGGQHSFKVMYNGDRSFGPSVSNRVAVTVRRVLVEALGASYPPSITVGSAVRVQFALLSPGVLPPTGTVDVYDNRKRVASQLQLAHDGLFGQGTAQLSYTFTGLKVGRHHLQITYPGDANHLPSGLDAVGNNNAGAWVTVNAATGAANQVILTQSEGTVTIGDSVKYSVTVKPMKVGGSVPTGTITLLGENGRQFGNPVNLSSGAATITFNWTFAGESGVVAAYSGDSNYTASDSSFIVTHVKPGTPTVKLSADALEVVAGTATSLTVSTLGMPSNPQISLPSGEVVFFDSVDGGADRRLGSGFLTTGNGGNPIFTLPVVLPNGHNLIHVHYVGSSDWNATDSNGVQVVVK